MGKAGAATITCRNCHRKGEHWTAMCPYKDIASPAKNFIDRPPSSTSDDVTKGAYVPPSMRAGAERTGTEMKRGREENCVMVTNLSEDTREPDLHELFGHFGSITRLFVARDQTTGTSRGFGYVHFSKREEAERAINKLNGYGYDHLILGVVWAASRISRGRSM